MITLAHGAGGTAMHDLIRRFGFNVQGWSNCTNDSATISLGDHDLAFTTDSFVVTPLFFPGGNIGHIAFCGTVNDLAVMGAKPIGLSLSLIIEEGFPDDDLMTIISSMKKLSHDTGIPIVTGDTKVMEKGKLDKLVINTSGIGIAKRGQLLVDPPMIGDKIILSGGIAEHAVALLSRRFDYECDVISDSKPLVEEIASVHPMIKLAKDPTRGGLSAALNEISSDYKIGMRIYEELIPARTQAKNVCEMLGLNILELASEGRFVCIARPGMEEKVVANLRRFNPDAAIIGGVTEGGRVVLKTFLGERIVAPPSGSIVPRIC